MSRRGRLWIAVDVELLDPMGNKFGIDDPAIMAYERCLAWCKRKMTDGHIPLPVASRFIDGNADALESAGLIARDGQRLVIPDWLKWNESTAQADERRARQAEWKRKRDHALSSKNKFSSLLLEEQSREEKSRDSLSTRPSSRRGVDSGVDAESTQRECQYHSQPWGCVADPDSCVTDPRGAA